VMHPPHQLFRAKRLLAKPNEVLGELRLVEIEQVDQGRLTRYLPKK
jgi:hypothetical protein